MLLKYITMRFVCLWLEGGKCVKYIMCKKCLSSTFIVDLRYWLKIIDLHVDFAIGEALTIKFSSPLQHKYIALFSTSTIKCLSKICWYFRTNLRCTIYKTILLLWLFHPNFPFVYHIQRLYADLCIFRSEVFAKCKRLFYS